MSRSLDAFGLSQSEKSAHGIVYVVEVACRGQVAYRNLSLARCYLPDNCRNDGASALSRAVGVEGPGDDHRQSEGVVETCGNSIGAYLRRRVRRLGLPRVFLVDGNVLCGAVDLAGGGDDDAVAPGIACGLAHIECAADVGVDVAVGCNVAVWNGYERRKMKHRAAVACYFATVVGVAHIAAYHFEAVVLSDVFKPAPVVEAVVLR